MNNTAIFEVVVCIALIVLLLQILDLDIKPRYRYLLSLIALVVVGMDVCFIEMLPFLFDRVVVGGTLCFTMICMEILVIIANKDLNQKGRK